MSVTGRPLKAVLEEVRTYQEEDHRGKGDDSDDDNGDADDREARRGAGTGRKRDDSVSVSTLLRATGLASLAHRANGKLYILD